MSLNSPAAAGALLLACLAAVPASAQSLTTLKHQAPEILIYGFVMTDGTVLAQGGGSVGGSLAHWFKLTPDNTGSYVNGTWSQVASAVTFKKKGGQTVVGPYTPYAGGGAVLGTGDLALVGGEYTGNNFHFSLTNESSVYSPFTNSWTPVAPPTAFQPGAGGFENFGDSPTTVLPGGNLLVGQKITKRDVALNPHNLSWIQYGRLQTEKKDFNAEEGWTLLPDGSIFTVDVEHEGTSERLIPALRPAGYTWIKDADTPVILPSPRDACCIPYDHGRRIYNPAGEIGPSIRRPDGTVFYAGSLAHGATAGHTAIYHPGASVTAKGYWTVGPDFQPGDDAGDNFGTLEPSGNVLVLGDKFYVVDKPNTAAILEKRALAAQSSSPYANLYEWNGSTFAPLPVKVPGGSSLLPLPNGQVFVMAGNELVYTPTGTYQQAWAPTIATAPTAISAGGTYKITGTQFNGLGQACAYGDEFQCATNYPLVRITNTASGHVIYARTHDHSTMGVATGAKLVWTYFDVPSGIETGASTLVVVANGIPSTPVDVTVN